MKNRSITRRKISDIIIKIISSISAIIGILFLIWIIFEVSSRGLKAIKPQFFLHLPTPPGISGGGVANAILGTLAMVMLASLIGIPAGLFTGIYLSEYGKKNRFGEMIRFSSNMMMGIPSIIVGLFVYTLMVLSTGHFSGFAGALALAIIMMPVITRVTEDMLNLVPNSLREAALALGSPRWKMTILITFRAAKSGLITGMLLGIARVSGETAPLLFTALNSPFWPRSLNQPTANLTVTIFNYAMSPYRDWQEIAWGASFLIMGSVLILNIFTRIILKGDKK